MKAKELKERSAEALQELEKSLSKQAFEARIKNHTAQLNDTASIRRARRDVARVKTVLTQKAMEAARAAKNSAAGGK